MQLFLDTAHIAEIEEALTWGFIDGVTTNPAHVAKTQQRPADLYPRIVEMVDGPVSLETVTLTAGEIVDEALRLADYGENVIVKVPVMKEGLMAVEELSRRGIKTNVTVCYSPLQALLAAKAGATYVSPFVGRLDSVGHNGVELVDQIRTIYGNYGYGTQIIVAAVRHPMHILDSAVLGADVATASFDIMKSLWEHPLTDLGIQMFLDAWSEVPK